MLEFHCEHCGQPLTVDEEYAGVACECPTCNGTTLAPGGEASLAEENETEPAPETEAEQMSSKAPAAASSAPAPAPSTAEQAAATTIDTAAGTDSDVTSPSSKGRMFLIIGGVAVLGALAAGYFLWLKPETGGTGGEGAPVASGGPQSGPLASLRGELDSASQTYLDSITGATQDILFDAGRMDRDRDFKETNGLLDTRKKALNVLHDVYRKKLSEVTSSGKAGAEGEAYAAQVEEIVTLNEKLDASDDRLCELLRRTQGSWAPKGSSFRFAISDDRRVYDDLLAEKDGVLAKQKEIAAKLGLTIMY